MMDILKQISDDGNFVLILPSCTNSFTLLGLVDLHCCKISRLCFWSDTCHCSQSTNTSEDKSNTQFSPSDSLQKN